MQQSKERQSAFLISNLHCSSCVASIEQALKNLEIPPINITHSIIDHTISITYSQEQSEQLLKATIENEGYEVEAIIHDPNSYDSQTIDDSATESELKAKRPKSLRRLRSASSDHDKQHELREKHRLNCKQCQLEGVPELSQIRLVHDPSLKSFVAVDSAPEDEQCLVTLTVDGLTCASCVGTITQALESKPWVQRVDVNLLTGAANVRILGKAHADDLVYAIQDVGYDATIDAVRVLSAGSRDAKQPSRPQTWQASYSIGGMSCSSCVGTITNALNKLAFVKDVSVSLVANSATVTFEGKVNNAEITELIQDLGYDAALEAVVEVEADQAPALLTPSRTVQIRVDGMYCEHCIGRIADALSTLELVEVEQLPTLKHPVAVIKYVPNPPSMTIRSILKAVTQADDAFHAYVHHPLSIEERARNLHLREQRHLLYRLLLAIIVAIPTFIIGIVLMSMVPSTNSTRQYIMTPLAGISRAEWALFIMATPVYFFAADIFHKRMMKELRALWRRRSPTPISQRLYRFGSMNMLISLGTTIAYVSSIVEMALAGAQNHDRKMAGAERPTYFDSVVFLTMFLLVGRYIEAHAKTKTGDAVASLGQLRPTTALLQTTNACATENGRFLEDFQQIGIDLVDQGDVVRVPYGASPPCDGIIVAGSTKFDESSLTGEARPVSKIAGDEVFSGTVNIGSAVSIRVTGVSGNSMLDQIMRVVREGQAKRAPIERVADRITGYFVPFVCLIAVITWTVWLGLGLSASLPVVWRDTADNWPFWSLQFAIAVFVVACPCGIGLAAPTALFVGGGLAAKFGILVKGGGEAFQEASNLDCIVFDKTGTLTEGGEPVVTDFKHVNECPDIALGKDMVIAIAKVLEEDSTHPLAKAINAWSSDDSDQPDVSSLRKHDTQEIPGQGIKGVVSLQLNEQAPDTDIEVIVGSETMLQKHDVMTPPNTDKMLHKWREQGKSVVLTAIKLRSSSVDEKVYRWWTIAAFAVSDPVRAEAAEVVSALQKRRIDVWMISGDNPTTAYAIGDKVGIPQENIIAGVLPEQKAEKVKMLQNSQSKHGNQRTTVAMVGDGINDSPALTHADVGIAIGSGSDVAINAASFVLLKSELTSVLTLIDLSRSVFRRIKFNFFWALIYNLAALPIAAGVLFPVVTSSGSHIRLDPVWAALAMALSSISVVCSSLVLRSKLPLVGFRGSKKQVSSNGQDV